MLKHLFTKAPLIAILGATIVFTIVAGAGLGLDWPLLTVVALAVFAVGESFALWSYWRKTTQSERHLRHLRFVADRLQYMLRCLPGGYCLFTPQGLLREEQGVSGRLGSKKITHLDDLVAAVKEGSDLLAAFRKLQLSGDPFAMAVHAAQTEDRAFWLVGNRFRIGREGPHADVLWFCDYSKEALKFMPVPEGTAKTATPDTPVSKEAHATAQKLNLHEAQLQTTVAEDKKGEKPNAQPDSPPSHQDKPVSMALQQIERCFDLLPFPVWARQADLSLAMCNEAYARVMDIPRETVLSEQHELMGLTSKGGKALASEVFAAGAPITRRDHAVINGHRRLLQVVERPLPPLNQIAPNAQTSDPIVLVGFAIDVTAEEEKEKELRRHLVSHHEVLEHLGAAIGVFGPDAKLEFYNRAYLRLWEAQESFLDSKPTFGEVLEDLRARRKIPEQTDFQKYKKDYLNLFTSLLEPREDVLHLPDSTCLRNLIAPHPLGGLMFVYENVTDQLELETNYNTLMAVQCETIDNLAEGIAVFGPDGRLRLFNPALGRVWAYSSELLSTDTHVSDLIEAARPLLGVPDDQWPERKEKMVSYALDRKQRAGRIERADNSVVEYMIVPLPDGSVLNSFLDVTDSLRVEQALRASNAALATADRLKSDFVANVSYQLRTPLNTIMGFADILSEQYFGTLNERQLEYTTTIRAESEKLSHLINNVLDLAMIEAGRLTLDQREISVAELLNESKELMAEWGRQQSLEILIDCPSDIGTFEVDEVRIKQVLFNLVGNAIKYTPPGGHIAIVAWKQDPWIILSVLDTGVGIPQEDKDRIFGKFEKANAHLRQGGAGLGLSLVKSFVELHGGRVELFSDEKDGTRISCFLPIKSSQPERADPAQMQA
jgi:signal transduction histidine kinase